MPTLRELRPANSRSAVSSTIACRSARLRRTGAEASMSAKCRAAVTQRIVPQKRDGAVRGTPGEVALGDQETVAPAGAAGIDETCVTQGDRRSAVVTGGRGAGSPAGGR